MRFSNCCGVGLAALLLAGLPAALAAAASDDDIAEIKRKVEEQEKTIRVLKTRVEELEAEAEAEAETPAAPPVSAAPEKEEAGSAQADQPPSPVEEVERDIRLGKRAPVVYRGTLNDRQSAAARAGDYTLDPDYRGFIPVPNTVVMIKFNAKPRVDFIGDTGDAGTDFRFVTALFPPSTNSAVAGRVKDDGWQFGANANGTQLIVDVQAPSVEGTPRFYYQNDFFGSNTNHMNYRLQHLYGEYAGFLAGFTFGVFEDPDAWPNTVDYEGPNSVIFARRPVAQYKRELFEDVAVTLAVEDPDIYVDLTGDAAARSRFRAPDTGFAVEWSPGELGHLRASAIFRSIGVASGAFGSQDVFGWGINTSGNLRVTSRDNVQYWFVYGHGIGGLGNDTSFLNSDAAFNGAGELEALQYWSAMLAMTHQWSPRWSSTGSYGHVYLENTALQLPEAYHRSHYGSINVVYQLFKRVRIGLEGLYGYKEVHDGRDNDIFRIQLGVAFALFD